MFREFSGDSIIFLLLGVFLHIFKNIKGKFKILEIFIFIRNFFFPLGASAPTLKALDPPMREFIGLIFDNLIHITPNQNLKQYHVTNKVVFTLETNWSARISLGVLFVRFIHSGSTSFDFLNINQNETNKVRFIWFCGLVG